MYQQNPNHNLQERQKMDNRALFNIRFNHAAENENERWKLIFNNQEYWLKDIIIDGLAYTTQDWIASENTWKWHISVYGTCLIKDNVATITSVNSDLENRKFRHFLKALSFIGLETLGTFAVSLVSTNTINTAFAVSSTYFSARFLLYYIHERIWYQYIKMKK